MEKIYVYADFDFLEQTEEIGVLSYERVRGNDHFAFEFSREWLSRHGGMILSGDVMNVRGMQHPSQGNSVFGFVKDSFPDRWGRILLDRRERLAAHRRAKTREDVKQL
jgi:serine/threonine-protein kinase HipA